VRLAQQVGLGHRRDPAEDLVGVGDVALEVGLGDDDVVGAEDPFDPGRSMTSTSECAHVLTVRQATPTT